MIALIIGIQGKIITPILLNDQPTDIPRMQDKTSRVWWASGDQALPHIQNNWGLYQSDKPDSYSLVSHLDGGYIIAAPLATKNPNTFVLLNDYGIAVISAWDAATNKTLWKKSFNFNDSYSQPGAPVIYSTQDGSLLMFVVYDAPWSLVRFLDGATGEEVDIPGADIPTPSDDGSFRAHPMSEHHLVIFYTERDASTVRVVDASKKQVVFSTGFFDGWFEFVAPSALWYCKGYYDKREAHFVDLAANKTKKLPMEKVEFTSGVSYASPKIIAMALSYQYHVIVIRIYDLEKLAFEPGNWSVGGELMHLEENGRMVLYNQDKGRKFFLANFVTNKTWELANDQKCTGCDAGYIVTKDAASPYVVVLDHCACKSQTWSTLVYQVDKKLLD